MDQWRKFEGDSAARAALACMDLTSLGEADSALDIQSLCGKSSGPAGKVAAVCVWPRFAALAKSLVGPSLHVAAVVNFPSGAQALEQTLREIQECLEAGADEIDMVFPYGRFLGGDEAGAQSYVASCKKACGQASLKVILESGCYPSIESISKASLASLAAGADFLKTSTGKIARGASPEAARAMMEAIASTGSHAGFKASGGVKTVADAALYLNLASEILGVQADPARFRIGASGLLATIESHLAGAPAVKSKSSY